jgi:hypothetical protein
MGPTDAIIIRDPKETMDLDIPDIKQRFDAIGKFQALVRNEMREGSDYGIIPGTSKPTLLKPGAEKITKLLNLSDQYIIEDKIEDWSKGFFMYRVKCTLRDMHTGVLVSEGIGSINSLESKYRWRTIYERDLPPGASTEGMQKITKSGRGGSTYTVFRVPNDDIFSQVNTLLKMAKKRAMVDAALSVGRLSNLFTQDLEEFADDFASVEKETKVSEPKAKAEPASSDDEKKADLVNKIKDTLTRFGMKPKDAIEFKGWLAKIQKDVKHKFVDIKFGNLSMNEGSYDSLEVLYENLDRYVEEFNESRKS